MSSAAAKKREREYQRRYYLRVTKKRRREQRKRAPQSRLRVGRCVYCGTEGKVSDDHVTPRSRGGADDPSNTVDCCLKCNGSKGRRTLDEWRCLIARRSLGVPYFSPAQIKFVLGNGLDIAALIEREAKRIKFFFEGGDGALIATCGRRMEGRT